MARIGAKLRQVLRFENLQRVGGHRSVELGAGGSAVQQWRQIRVVRRGQQIRKVRCQMVNILKRCQQVQEIIGVWLWIAGQKIGGGYTRKIISARHGGTSCYAEFVCVKGLELPAQGHGGVASLRVPTQE